MIKLLILLFTFNAYAIPPVAVNGEQQAKAYIQNIVVPNYQATKIGGIDTRLETGSKNLLINPSFEITASPSSSWSLTNITASTSTTALHDGKATLSAASTGTNWSVNQDSTLYATAKSGQDMEGSVWVYSATASADIWLCPRINGAAASALSVANGCMQYTNLGGYQKLTVYMLGGSTSTGIEIRGSATSTTTVIDDAYLGDRRPSANGPTTTPETNATVTFSAGFGTVTPSTNQCKYSRIGNYMNGTCFLTSPGTVAANLLSMTVPGGFTIDSSKILATNTTAADGQSVGDFYSSSANYFGSVVTATGTDATKLYFGPTISNATILKPANGNGVAASSVSFSMKFRIPILEWAGDNNAFTTKCDDPRNCETVFSANITTTSGAVTTQSTGTGYPWIASCTAANPTVCTITGFTVAPNCTATASALNNITIEHSSSATSTTLSLKSVTADTGAAQASIPFNIVCQKQGADYLSSRISQQIIQSRGVGVQLQTQQNSTSGTFIDFTGIPATAKRITVMFNGVSLNATNSMIVQVGNGSVVTSGYTGSNAYIAPSTASGTVTTGFGVSLSTGAATNISGNMVISLNGSNSWTASSVVSDDVNGQIHFGAGRVSLGSALDRVRITTIAGTAAFDLGSINISWEN